MKLQVCVFGALPFRNVKWRGGRNENPMYGSDIRGEMSPTELRQGSGFGLQAACMPRRARC